MKENDLTFEKLVEKLMKENPSFRGCCGFLSNFFKTTIRWNGISFWSAELLYHFLSCRTDEERERILISDAHTITPLRKQNKTRPDWDNIKVDFMYEILKMKFHQGGIELAQRLVDIPDSIEIIERTTWNGTYWGVDSLGSGENILGKLLMRLRNELRKEILGNVFKSEYESEKLYNYINPVDNFLFSLFDIIEKGPN